MCNLRSTGFASALRLVCLLLMMQGLPCHAQDQAAESPETYKFDLGAGIGLSGYLGDANESNMFKHAGVAGNVSLRYLLNTRWAFRGVISLAQISGDTGDWENALPGGARYTFKSTVADLSGRAEFNFFSYGIGERYRKLSRFTPYLALGVGVAYASASGSSTAAFELPMAVGVKFKLKPRLNLGLEFCMTKIFSDKVDSADLTDLYQIKSSWLKNTDWVSSLQLSLSYEFGKRCVTCHRID